MSLVWNFFLFTTMATPLALLVEGSGEWRSARWLPKMSENCFARSSVRCVSWTARRSMLRSRIIWGMCSHLSRSPEFLPLILREAILKFAFVPFWRRGSGCGSWTLCPIPLVCGGVAFMRRSSARGRSRLGRLFWVPREPLPALDNRSSGFIGPVAADPSPREFEDIPGGMELDLEVPGLVVAGLTPVACNRRRGGGRCTGLLGRRLGGSAFRPVLQWDCHPASPWPE